MCVCNVALNADAEHAPRPEPSTCNRQLAGSAQTWSVRHRICHAGRPPHPALSSIKHHANPYHCRCPSSAATSCRCPPRLQRDHAEHCFLLHLFLRRPSSMRRPPPSLYSPSFFNAPLLRPSACHVCCPHTHVPHRPLWQASGAQPHPPNSLQHIFCMGLARSCCMSKLMQGAR